jgi:hypothetical protein
LSIEVYPDTKVYVVAPAHTATGGPELLHQLVYHLRNDLNIDAYMYYVPEDHPNPVHPAYKQYNVPYVEEISDDEKNILVVPERYEFIKYTLDEVKFINIRKVIWWLSVDNFLTPLIEAYKNKTILSIDDVHKYVKENFNFHLAQSYYAINFLKEIKIPEEKIFYLSDYLNTDFLKTKVNLSKKENIVAYNPQKGYLFTKRLIKKAKHINFIPIINMNRKQVIELLKKAKVYIDFGNHPGKDRIPREAAILGCCVITGKKGSAKFFEDVPIPEEYKFEDKMRNTPYIINKINDCFENFEERYNDFEYYRNKIKKEPQKFKEDLEKFFKLN